MSETTPKTASPFTIDRLLDEARRGKK